MFKRITIISLSVLLPNTDRPHQRTKKATVANRGLGVTRLNFHLFLFRTLSESKDSFLEAESFSGAEFLQSLLQRV